MKDIGRGAVIGSIVGIGAIMLQILFAPELNDKPVQLIVYYAMCLALMLATILYVERK